MNAPESAVSAPHPFQVHALSFDKDLIERMPSHGPRYTSYPTADRFHQDFAEAEYRTQVAQTFVDGQVRPLSLYVHVPFCNTICYYCGCNKIITKNKAHAASYLDYLDKEMALQAPLFAGKARVEQLHFGGGTPTFLSDDQLTRLMGSLRRHFDFAPKDEGEYSIEIDPRKVQASTVALLGALGFNRMSLGVQDFDPAVQAAVNRIQSVEETLNVIHAARANGFRSVSIDLIYGLPLQTVAGFARTLQTVIDVRPDRLSIYNYAHLPHLFKTQKQINEADLPSAAVKLEILAQAISQLSAAGYVYIGMDHFALPDDELARAQRAGTLHRNFQGYSTHDDIDLLALGISGIGKIGASYNQNVKTTEGYYALLDAGRLPIFRGLQLTRDDELRRAVIQELMCQFTLDFERVEHDWQIRVADYFATEWQDLQHMAADGLVTLSPARLEVTPRGRLLVRNIAMVFDRYLRQGQPLARFSRTI